MLPSFHPTVGWCARRGWSGCLLVSSTRKDRRLLREQRKKCTFLLSAAREKRAEKYSPRIIVRRTMINFSISWNQRKNSILFLLVYSLTLSDEYLNVCSKKRKRKEKPIHNSFFPFRLLSVSSEIGQRAKSRDFLEMKWKRKNFGGLNWLRKVKKDWSTFVNKRVGKI